MIKTSNSTGTLCQTLALHFYTSFVCFILLFFGSAGHATEHQDEAKLVITHDMQLHYARQLYDEKSYDTAIVEYRRFLHFFPDSPKHENARFYLALCQFYLKEYLQAARGFNEIILAEKKADLVREAVFLQSRAFMNMGNNGYAELVLQNFLKLTDDLPTKDRIYFNLALIHLAEAKKGRARSLDTARKHLSSISPEGRKDYQTDNYDRLISTAVNAPRKNPAAAGALAVVPGGGFFYCERYKDALVTFLLNAGLMIAAWQAWDDGNEALAGVIGFVETGFYSANIYGAISSAHKYNRAQIFRILDREVYIRPEIDKENRGVKLSLDIPF